MGRFYTASLVNHVSFKDLDLEVTYWLDNRDCLPTSLVEIIPFLYLGEHRPSICSMNNNWALVWELFCSIMMMAVMDSIHTETDLVLHFASIHMTEPGFLWCHCGGGGVVIQLLNV